MGHYTDKAEIVSYSDIQNFFVKAKTPDKGRRLKSWCRVFRVSEGFELRFEHDGPVLALLRPDNTLELKMTIKFLRNYSHTITGSMHRALPVAFVRRGKSRYTVGHAFFIDDCIDGGVPAYLYMKDSAPEYFDGIMFDLNTGECINQKPRLQDTLVPEKRTEWLRALRKFKQGIRVRAKIGVLDTLCRQVAKERSNSKVAMRWQKPDWSSDSWITTLYTAIKDEQFPNDLLIGFVQSAPVSYWRQESPTPAKTLEAVDSVCDDLSIELRTRFGVFQIT